jgi:hypothetical protein
MKWKSNFRDELYSAGLGCNWHKGKDWNIRVMCQETVNRSNDTDRHTKTEKMREKSNAHREMKKEWGREQYTC